jgi:phage/plasmid-associated DNA primase
MLAHLGSGLDEVVRQNDWCTINNVTTGGDYLFLWAASLFQRPAEPLPYLFFFGEQNTGKSTFHEALHLLFRGGKGYVRADRALKDKSGFNGELENSVLNVVEETDLSKERQASERIKDWVTGRTISIRTMYRTAYDIVNTTHWVQCANDAKNVLILRGDTRIVAIEVPRLKVDIPKHQFLKKLTEEAPAFLYELLNTSLPEAPGRLSIPVLDSGIKKEMMSSNMSLLEQYIDSECKIVVGQMTHFADFYNGFRIWISRRAPSEITLWNERRIVQEFPRFPDVLRGRYGPNKSPVLCNFSLHKDDEPTDKIFTLTNGEICIKE